MSIRNIIPLVIIMSIVWNYVGVLAYFYVLNSQHDESYPGCNYTISDILTNMSHNGEECVTVEGTRVCYTDGHLLSIFGTSVEYKLQTLFCLTLNDHIKKDMSIFSFRIQQEFLYFSQFPITINNFNSMEFHDCDIHVSKTVDFKHFFNPGTVLFSFCRITLEGQFFSSINFIDINTVTFRWSTIIRLASNLNSNSLNFFDCYKVVFLGLSNFTQFQFSISFQICTCVQFTSCTINSVIRYQLGTSISFVGCAIQSPTVISSVDKIEINNCRLNHATVKRDFLAITSFKSVSITNSTISDIRATENIVALHTTPLNASTTPLNASFVMINVSFSNNIGTSIYTNSSLKLCHVYFHNNTGNFAGAVFIDVTDRLLQPMISFIQVTISDNKVSADHGGDIYIRTSSEYPFHFMSNDLTFDETSHGIYIDSSNCYQYQGEYFPGISADYLRTSAKNISQYFKKFNTFSGKRLYFSGSIKVTDYFGNEACCNAVPKLVYENETDAKNCPLHIHWQSNNNKKIRMQSEKELLTQIYITTIHINCSQFPINMILMLTCEDVSTAVNLTLRECPLGYTVSNHSQHVVCEATDDIVSDDSKEHIACIERDYWYGEMNSTSGHSRMIKSPCGPPYCVNDKEACPIDGYTDTHQILPWTQDEQCNGYYGGVLCRSCREQAVFTFGASKCIPLSECKQWQPYLIICLVIVGQIVLTLVMICSRTKTTVGVGYLYGPLFFIAVYKLLPISNKYFLLTSPLEMTFSIYESILLLDLDVLGKVNWCFFNLDEAVHYSMRFIGPLITFLVLLVVVLIAKNNFCYKFRINRIIQSPIQPMCLLIMLSFWSLSKTSIEIIKPIIINGEWRFAIQPEYAYLGNGYIIGLFCISVVLLTIFYLPFILLLLSSQFIRLKINLFRIQPFLDAFQSSYKDNCQWFSGVYLLSWLILNTELPPYAFIIVSLSISAIHFIVHPHKSTFLNVADSLLLVDMLILSSLSYFSEHHTIMVIKYPLLIIPLMYILMGGVWISIRGTVQKCINKYRYPVKNDDSVMQVLPVDDVIDSGDIDVHESIVPQDIVITQRDEMEREPLIYDDY